MTAGLKIRTTFLFLMVLLIPINAQWKPTGSLLQGTITKADYVYCFAQTNNGSVLYQYAGTSSGAYISTNYGTSWIVFRNGLNTSDPSVLTIWPRGSSIYSGGYGGLYYSTNFGANWASIAGYDNGFTVPAVTSIVFNGQNILASTISGGVFRSSDQGSKWVEVNDGLPSTPPWIYSLLLAPYSGTNYIFAATAKGVHVTPNSGVNWYSANTNIPTTTSVYSIIAKGTMLLAGTGDGIYKSVNFGNIWYKGADPGFTTNCFAIYGSNIFAGTYYGVYLSTNNGDSWTRVSDGLSTTATDVMSLSVMGPYLFAGTYQGGVWRRPLSEMVSTTSIQSGEIPSNFTLSQNYPNPFNPSTTINYTIPSVETLQATSLQHVTLQIYDVLGRGVATLVDENQSSGTHSVSFAADKFSLPSGIYFYTLRSGNYALTKKMLLLK